jgi:hypothetical protein
MGRLRLWTRSGPLGLAAIALGSCGIAPVSLPPPSLHGTEDTTFQVSFPDAVREHTYLGAGTRIPQYGVGIVVDRTYTSGITTSHEVNVSVGTLTNRVPHRRLRPFLRSYLPSTHGGRIVQWHGFTAAIGFLAPSCTPDGSCFGVQGSLVVVEGMTLFDVSTSQTDFASAMDVLSSFRIVHASLPLRGSN